MKAQARILLILAIALLLSPASRARAEGGTPSPGRQDASDESALGREVRRNFRNRLRADLGLTDAQVEAVVPKIEKIERERTAERVERRQAARALLRSLRRGDGDAVLESGLARLESVEDEHRARVRSSMEEIDRELTVRQRIELRFFVARYAAEMRERVQKIRGGGERPRRGARPQAGEGSASEDSWP